MSRYPEHEKLQKISDQSQIIGNFLEWMPSAGYYIGEYIQDPEWKDYQFVSTQISINNILAKFFEIDLDKLEDEKMQMLKEIREVNKI